MSDQGEGQNPGTYTGADGREYRWVSPQNNGQYRPVLTTTLGYECGIVYLSAADWPAAKAALDALVEAEQEEWVEIGEPQGLCEGQRRIRRDGSQPQTKAKPYYGEQKWVDLATSAYWVDAYRKGREVALEEASDLRDAVRELVRTINAMPSVTFDCSVLPIMEGGYHLAEDVRVDVNARQLMRWMDTLDKAAKKLEGKL